MDREPDTVSVGGTKPAGLVSQLALQHARARLLGRSDDALTSIGRYRITQRIGIGGMGVVYAAHDPDLERAVAVKVLRSETDGDPRRQQFLLREAQALARLSHPNVVQVYEVGRHDGHVFLAMELVEGRTLRAWVHAHRPSVREIVGHYIEAGRGLDAAHAANVLHRDFKPDNALIGRDGRVRVLDFGLARRDYDRGASSELSDEWPTHPGIDAKLTASGTVMGTLRYMPPEQHAGEELTPAADQFAFCASLWGALVRAPAFPGQDPDALALAKQLGPPAWPRAVKAPGAVIAALRRGLAPEIGDRWPSMQHLIDALGDGISNRRRNRIAAAGVGVAVLGVSGVAASWSGAATHVCAGAADRLGDAWSGERRESASEAFAGGPSYAAATWNRIAPELDAYAVAWAEQYTDNCEGTRVRGDQSTALMDARSVCLGAARRELEATTRLLANADAQTIERADDLVRGLPALDRCSDAEQLLASVPAPPSDLADAVAAVRDELADVTALQRAGKYDEADAALQPAIAHGSSIDYAPLQTELQFELGMLRERQGRYDEAEAAQAIALRTGLGTGQWDLAVQAANALVIVVGNFAAEPERGLAYSTTAWGIIGRTSNPLRHEAELRRTIGAVHRTASNIEASIEELRQALRVTLSDPNADPLDIADVRSTLGLALMHGGKLQAAEVELRAALEIRRERTGAEHPRTATTHQNLGSVLKMMGRLDEAEKEYDVALAVLIAAHGERNPRVAMVRGNLANIYAETGRQAQAVSEAREVASILAAVHPPTHPLVISSRTNLASAMGANGQHEEAAEAFRGVIDSLKDAPPSTQHALAAAHLGLNLELVALGKPREALAAAREGLAIRERLYDDDHPDVAEARNEVGSALLDLGEAEPALPLLEAAWRVHERGGATVTRRADTGFSYAKAIRATRGDEATARRIAETSRDFLDADSQLRAKIQAWLDAPA